MSIIKDVIDAFDEIKKGASAVTRAKGDLGKAKEAATAETRFFSRPMDSVARNAKKSVLYFPVVASESLSAETVTVVTKAVQVRAAEYVRLWVSNMDPVELAQHGKGAVIASLRGATLKDALLKDPYAVQEATDTLVRTRLSTLIEHAFFEDGMRAPLYETPVFLSEVKKPGPPANVAGANTISQLVYDISALATNNGKVGEAEAMKRLRELLRDPAVSRNYILALDPDLSVLLDRIDADMTAADEAREAKRTVRPTKTPEQEERERRDRLVQDTIDLANRKTANGQISRTGRLAAMKNIQQIMSTNDGQGIAALRRNAETARIVAMMEKLPGRVLEDGTYEVSGNAASVADSISFDKINQFQPVLLDLRIRFKLADGSLDQAQTPLLLGVKGVAHQVPGLDLVTGLGTALQRDNFVLQFFRMTSGETSFVKDFLLNLNTAKMRASGRTTSGAKVLETLRRQAEWNDRRANYFVKAVTNRGFVPPTTTMVVSADEVEQIKSLYGVDFSKPSAVRDLLKSHNLMGFIIVDEAIGLVRVFEDGDDDFDRMPIATLKTQGKETSIKDIMTILARS